MSGQPAGVSVPKRTVAMVLFSTLMSSTVRFQLDRVCQKITHWNLMKPSLVYLYYMHSGYRSCFW